jgi:hypothetical protein
MRAPLLEVESLEEATARWRKAPRTRSISAVGSSGCRSSRQATCRSGRESKNWRAALSRAFRPLMVPILKGSSGSRAAVAQKSRSPQKGALANSTSDGRSAALSRRFQSYSATARR